MIVPRRFLPAALALAAAAVLVLPPPAAAQSREKALGPKYREWMDLVSWIILPAERDVFLKLTQDRDRDIFIESFWKQRDPTPGTPQNEYREEHLKRFQYANEHFRRGTTRPGWMTDQGRIYIVLGEPRGIDRFEGNKGIYPCEVWLYYAFNKPGLPSAVNLTFFQRRGSGEFKLYSPVADGPMALMEDPAGLDPTDYQALYEKVREMAPTLAGPSLSLLPNQYSYGMVPSPQNAIILSQILESPRKDVNPVYATHFLNYRGMVSTEYLTNYVESAGAAALIRDPALGLDLLHVSISPKSITTDFYAPKNQYYASFKLSVTLRRGQTIVYQASKDFPFYFDEDKTAAIGGNGVSIQDLVPVVEGSYDLTLLLQNSVGKEFSLFETKVAVPEAGGGPRLSGPVLGYRLQPGAGPARAPFKILDRQLLVDPKATIGTEEEAAFYCGITGLSAEAYRGATLEAEVRRSDAPDGTPAAKSMTVRLADEPFAPSLAVTRSFPAADLGAGYYDLTVRLKGGDGAILAQSHAPFIVATQPRLPHPVTVVRAISAAAEPLLYFAAAFEYDKIGDPGRAARAFEAGLARAPEPAGQRDYADFLVRWGRAADALAAAEKLAGNDRFAFDYHRIRGQALAALGKDADALASFQAANRIYNSDTRVLNGLALCWSRTGDLKSAVEALRASLGLNPDQPEAKALLEKLQKK